MQSRPGCGGQSDLWVVPESGLGAGPEQLAGLAVYDPASRKTDPKPSSRRAANG